MVSKKQTKTETAAFRQFAMGRLRPRLGRKADLVRQGANCSNQDPKLPDRPTKVGQRGLTRPRVHPGNRNRHRAGILHDHADPRMLANPSLSINQLASREGRCRKQLGKLLRLSWLSPRLAEAIADGDQPQFLTRSRLLEADLPIDWSEQEELLGFAR